MVKVFIILGLRCVWYLGWIGFCGLITDDGPTRKYKPYCEMTGNIGVRCYLLWSDVQSIFNDSFSNKLLSKPHSLAITQIRVCNVVINLHLHPMKWLRSGLEDLWTLWSVLWRNTLNCNGYLEGVPGIILFTWHQLYLNCQGKVLVVLSFLFIAFLSDKACKDSLVIGCLVWFHGGWNTY